MSTMMAPLPLERLVGFLAAVRQERPAALLLIHLTNLACGSRQGRQAAEEAPVGLVGPRDRAVALPAVAAGGRPGEGEGRVLRRDVYRGGARGHQLLGVYLRWQQGGGRPAEQVYVIAHGT